MITYFENKINLELSWEEKLNKEFDKVYMKNLKEKLFLMRKKKIIYPKSLDVFKVLQLTPFNRVKVVIVGQDPYPGVGQAHGLSFSVSPIVRKIPASLMNIFIELKNDLGIAIPDHGCLVNWSLQGVFLLNSILTVEKGLSGSHINIGWEIFTDKILELLNCKLNRVVFVLWGNFAKRKRNLIDKSKHLIISSSHPSPHSANINFFNSKPFSRINNYLIKFGKTPINWNLGNKFNFNH